MIVGPNACGKSTLLKALARVIAPGEQCRRHRGDGGVGLNRGERSGPRFVDELSSGQRQRVWIAMLLPRETPILLLDEPATYLDIVHQYDVLDLFAASTSPSTR